MQGIILDLDDTLYLEHEYVQSGFLAVGRSLSDDPDEGQRYGEWLVKRAAQENDGQTFNHLLTAFPHLGERSDVLKMVRVYREHQPDLRLADEWREALEHWRHRGIFLGLISDGELVGQQRKVDALGLESLLDHIVFTDAYGKDHWKPSPTAFQEMERVSGLHGPALLYVGDNVLKDFVAPNSLGWRTVRLRLPLQVRDRLEPADETFAAQVEVNSFRVLRDLLESWL
ncbi:MULTISPECIES: HAD family hydrolase [Deinococcus]|uniref:HAD family hydrolase n=1 Tax=Deinococcus TaxID=1298 RepID=UPI0013769A7B|nr:MULTISPECIES: HAD family hydrolase [Deinococcus]